MFLAEATNYCPDSMKVILGFLHSILTLIQILIPVGLILVGSVDLGRAVLAGKEDEIKSHQKILFRRALAAVLVFFVTTIVTLLMGFIPAGAKDDNGKGVTWSNCWNESAAQNQAK